MSKDYGKEIIYQAWDIEPKQILNNKGHKDEKNYYILKELLSNNFIIDEYDDDNLYMLFRMKKSRDTLSLVVYKDCINLTHHSDFLTQCILDVTMGRSEATYYELLWNVSKCFSCKLSSTLELCALVCFTNDDLYNVPVLIKKIVKKQNDEINRFLKIIEKVKGL